MTGWLEASLLQHTSILLAVWLIDRGLASRMHPALRHGLWTLVLVRLVLPPGLIAWPAPAMAPLGIDTMAAVQGAGGSSAATGVLAIWLAGLLLMAALTIVRGRRLRTRLDPLADEDRATLLRVVERVSRACRLSRVPRLRLDTAVETPYVVGIVAPTLVVPRDWRRWPAATLRHVIGHELMHIRRRDLWAELAWRCATTIYWFHPLVHVARRRAYDAREMCCDADAARALGPGYRVSLLRVFTDLLGDRTSTAPAGHGWGAVIHRAHALDRWSRPRARGRRVATVALLALAALVVIPSHAVTEMDTPGVEELMDPVTRQERGLGSLHLRYLLMQQR